MKNIYATGALVMLTLTTIAQTFDTTGIGKWPRLYNSYETWMQGAFDANRNVNDPADFGWGNYDVSTHLITGDSIYILKTVAGNYKAVSIDQIASGVYTITHSNLDGSNRITKMLDRSNYNNRNFFYYQLDQDLVKDLEPASQDWDIVFTRFLTFFPGFGGYPVAGILHNHKVEASRVELQPGATANVNDTVQFPMDENISTIGYDWKDAFAGVVYDTLVYYVKDQAGNVNEFKLTGYGGSSTGKMVFEVNGQADSIVLGAGNTEQVYYSLEGHNEISTNQDNDWDLAFFAQSSFSAIPVRINDVNGAELHVYPKADISHWNSIGLVDQAPARLVSVYPNPTRDHLNLYVQNINDDQYTVQLLNTNGQPVLAKDVTGHSGMSEVVISVENVAAGIYILQVEGKNLKATTRIVVQP